MKDLALKTDEIVRDPTAKRSDPGISGRDLRERREQAKRPEGPFRGCGRRTPNKDRVSGGKEVKT